MGYGYVHATRTRYEKPCLDGIAAMKRNLLLLIFLLASLSAEAQDDERLALSRYAAAQLGQDLSAALLTSLGTDGPVEAVVVCSVEASPIAARLSEQAGAHVGRTALRIRNPENAPDDAAREVMAAFARDLAAGATAPPEHFQTRPDGSARYMSAIVTQPLCVTCHGSEIAPEVTTAISQNYPADQATGFAVGDLRGAFIVEWPAPTAQVQQ